MNGGFQMLDILFVTGAEEMALNREVNGIMLLATKLLQAGFSAKITHFCKCDSFGKDYPTFLQDMTEHILSFHPKCVSFYTLWPTYHNMVRLAKELKALRPELHIIFGGPQATGTALETMNAFDYIDFVCAGEGENTIVPFVTQLLREEKPDFTGIYGLVYRQNGKVVHNDLAVPLSDLETLPHWDDRLYDPAYFDDNPKFRSSEYFMPIDAGRGCPFGCTFCRASLFNRRTYRLKSPQRIIEDMLYFNKKFGIRSFWFTHDAFTTNKKLVNEVCDRIIESGLDFKWRCTARIDCVDEALIDKMVQAGMTQIELGVETGSPRMQKIINKRLDLTNVRKMTDYMQKKNIKVALFFMYGFPEETEDDLNKTLELVFQMHDSAVFMASLSFCRFFARTKLTKEYYEQLVFDPDMKMLTEGYFGLEDDLQMVLDNKPVFTHFFHLNTDIRNEYHFLYHLKSLYKNFPNSMRLFRALYNGDNLKFYKDFTGYNAHIFHDSAVTILDYVNNQPMLVMENWIKGLGIGNARQMLSVMQYDLDVQSVFGSRKDSSLTRTYDFNYYDFKLKLPIEKYTEGKTTILLKKEDGIPTMKVLKVE